MTTTQSKSDTEIIRGMLSALDSIAPKIKRKAQPQQATDARQKASQATQQNAQLADFQRARDAAIERDNALYARQLREAGEKMRAGFLGT
jgi:hypothetical protein